MLKRGAVYTSARPDHARFETILTNDISLSPVGYLRGLVAFLRHVRRHRPDVIVGAMPMSNVLAGLAAFIFGGSAVATHHSPLDRQSGVISRLDRIIGSLGGYARVVCVSQAVADSFADHPGRYLQSMQVLANGVQPVTASGDPARMTESYGLNPDMPVLLSAGRLAPQKNPLNLIRAIAKVEGVQLVMAGDGELKPHVEEEIRELGLSERVFLLGQLDRDALHDLMASCDGFIQVSLFEGQSLALLEAITAGPVIIISDIPTQVESLRGAGGAIGATLCDPADVDDIAHAIRKALFNALHRKNVADTLGQLRATVRTEEVVQQAYVEVFGGLVEKRASPSDAG